MQEQKIVLVTGGTGLIGKAIQKVIEEEDKRPEEKWYFVGSQDADLTDMKECVKLFRQIKPTHVINLAAMVGGLFANLERNLYFFTQNMDIAQNVLKCCLEFDVQKCISCLSTCIFPEKAPYPIDESLVHNGPPHNGIFGYSYAKRMIDVLNNGYIKDHGRKFISAIPCNVFGANDNFSLTDGHVIPALIHKCYLAKRDGTPLKVMGSGKSLRQFIYSIDLAKLFLWALREYEHVEPIIFSVDPEDEISIADVVKAIANAMDFKGEIIHGTINEDGQYRKTVSNKKLKNFLPNFKASPFEKAIEETVKWFVNNFEEARK